MKIELSKYVGENTKYLVAPKSPETVVATPIQNIGRVDLENIKANMEKLSPAQKKSVLTSSIMRMVLL